MSMGTGAPLWQTLLAGAINHTTVQGIAKALDWMAELPDGEAHEIADKMSPRHAQQFMRAVEAVQRPDE